MEKMTYEKAVARLEEIVDKLENGNLSLEEMMKLYKKYGVNPMSGCLPLLIQFPILFALYEVVRKPISYIWGQRGEALTQLFTQYGITGETAKVNGEIELAKKLFVEGHEWGINFNFLGLDLSQTPTFDMTSLLLGIDWIWILPVVAGLTTWISSKQPICAIRW